MYVIRLPFSTLLRRRRYLIDLCMIYDLPPCHFERSDLYRATLAVARGLGFFGLIRGTARYVAVYDNQGVMRLAYFF